MTYLWMSALDHHRFIQRHCEIVLPMSLVHIMAASRTFGANHYPNKCRVVANLTPSSPPPPRTNSSEIWTTIQNIFRKIHLNFSYAKCRPFFMFSPQRLTIIPWSLLCYRWFIPSTWRHDQQSVPNEQSNIDTPTTSGRRRLHLSGTSTFSCWPDSWQYLDR